MYKMQHSCIVILARHGCCDSHTTFVHLYILSITSSRVIHMYILHICSKLFQRKDRIASVFIILIYIFVLRMKQSVKYIRFSPHRISPHHSIWDINARRAFELRLRLSTAVYVRFSSYAHVCMYSFNVRLYQCAHYPTNYLYKHLKTTFCAIFS